LQVWLREKVQESDSYEKLLEHSEGKISPVTETTIPLSKAHIMNVQREKEEAAKRMKWLMHPGSCLEPQLDPGERLLELTAFLWVVASDRERFRSQMTGVTEIVHALASSGMRVSWWFL
jgi:hypothetical protein